MIKQTVKNGITLLSGLIPFNILQKPFHNEILIINYHNIEGYEEYNENKRFLYRTADEFKRDIKFLKNNFTILTLQEFLDIKSKKINPPLNPLLITFDDGLLSHYEIFYKVLNSQNVNATFFLNNAFINNSDLHYKRKASLLLKQIPAASSGQVKEISNLLQLNSANHYEISKQINKLRYKETFLLNQIAEILSFDFRNYLQINPLYLSDIHIREMIGSGYFIGGHSLDHPNYNELAEEDKIKQTVESVDLICKKYNLDYRVFAFPYDSEYQFQASFFHKIEQFVDASFGAHGIVKDQMTKHFQRFGVEGSSFGTKKAISYEIVKSLTKKINGKYIIRRN